MKKASIYLSVLLLGFSTAAMAQSDSTESGFKKDTRKAGHAIKKGATAVGNKTAELTVKGASKVADKTYKGKEGPNGETIYITADSRYYYIDKKGGKHFVTQDEIKDKG